MMPSFGIDFGTTNTRVAYFDGRTLQLAAFSGRQGEQVYQVPTAVAYRDGRAVAFGYDALAATAPITRFPKTLKWSLDSDEAVDLDDGQTKEPADAVADFLRSLRQVVAKSFPKAPLDRAAVTIPVHFPPAARGRLQAAFKIAGIEVTHFFFEPIAAIYAGLVGQPVSGVAAVFDWGGGSLDVAAVEVRDGVARTREVDGWHRGGTHFDRVIAEQAINSYLSQHQDDPMIGTLTAERVLDRKWGRAVLDQAVRAKEQLSRAETADVSALDFLNHGLLEYQLTRPLFADLIRQDLTGGMARLTRVLDASGVTPRTLARLYLSGGTCNVRDVRERLAGEYGNRVTKSLQLPPALVPRNAAGGLDDIGNATAIGAALLAGQGAAATFAASVGVRLAGGEGEGRFLPVFRQGEAVRFDQSEEVRLFVTNTSGGVARLLVCEQTDDVTQPAGRLLKVIPVPVVRSESWLRVGFRIDRHLTMQVRAVGVKNFQQDPTKQTPARNFTNDWIQSLKLGFQLPPA